MAPPLWRSLIGRLGLALATLVLVLMVALMVACDNDGPGSDADTHDTDGQGEDADQDPDGMVFPELDCGDDPDNMMECMVHLPEDADVGDWGVWCAGDCRPFCREFRCPDGFACHVKGVSALCMRE